MSVCVILSGCGVYDGSEVHEASAVCVGLARKGKKIVFFAPNKNQHHAINHLNGASDPQERNAMVESSRIARGAVLDLKDFDASAYEAVVVPGGFGAAKNLSTFGVSQEPAVDEDVERVLRDAHGAGKPIGLCCIAPILAAMVFGKLDNATPVKITLGKRGPEEKWPYNAVIEKAEAYGATVEEKEVDEICIDEVNKIVTTPAYMCHADFHEVHDGIAKMIDAVVELIHEGHKTE